MNSQNSAQCKLIDRFSLTERIIMRTGWYGFMAVAAVGIYKQSPFWAAVYAGYSILGFALVILPGLCAHCPFPAKHGTCLFLPPSFVTRFYPYKGPKMSPMGKFGALVVVTGVVVIPLFWLVSDPPMLILFLLFGLPTLAVFPIYYCKRCRHFDCPLNKAPSHYRQ